MKILKFLGLILFNIVYLFINYYLCMMCCLILILGQDIELPPPFNKLDPYSSILALIPIVWITKFLFFPILLTIGNRIKYIKKLVKIIKDNIIDKKSTLILALLFDCTLLLLATINSKFNICDWFNPIYILFIIGGGGILPVYVSMSLWSFLNKDSI